MGFCFYRGIRVATFYKNLKKNTLCIQFFHTGALVRRNVIILGAVVHRLLYQLDFRLKKRFFYFISALLLIIVCIDSPLYFIGENYLFSAHMIVHVLLLLIAGPLLVASIPAGKIEFKEKP